MNSFILIKDVRNEVHDRHGMEAAIALLHALENMISVTPQCLTKILAVLEGSALTEPATSKMKKELSKTFIQRRTVISASFNSGKVINQCSVVLVL